MKKENKTIYNVGVHCPQCFKNKQVFLDRGEWLCGDCILLNRNTRKLVLRTIIDVAKKAEQNQIEVPYGDYLTAAQQLLKKE